MVKYKEEQGNTKYKIQDDRYFWGRWKGAGIWEGDTGTYTNNVLFLKFVDEYKNVCSMPSSCSRDISSVPSQVSTPLNLGKAMWLFQADEL